MSDFANLLDGGRRLAPLVGRVLDAPADAVLLAAIPNGVPVALGTSLDLGLRVQAMRVIRDDQGASVPPIDDLDGLTVIVVDDGVETGTVAHAAADMLVESRAARRILAVPVCPREALAHLQHRFDEIVAVVEPMARRDLAWHYADFDTIDEHTAMRLLWDHNSIS